VSAGARPEPRTIGRDGRGATMVDALNAALDDELAADDAVVLLGEDIGRSGGVFRVTQGLQERYGSDRVWDTPIAEAGFVGMAVGMCLAGDRPVVELQFDSFSYPALEQIISHVGRYRWRTGGAAAMPLVLRIPFGGGTHAPELHSESPEAVFCHMPGLRVVCPSTPAEAYALLRWAIRCDDPVVFLEPKRRYRSDRADVTGEESLPRGEPGIRVARSGSDVTIVTYGAMVADSLAAADTLADEGVDVEVLDLRSLSPLDEDGVLEHVAATGRCVVVHEAPRSLGVGAEIAALLAARGLLSLQAPVQRVTGLDAPFPMYVHEFEYLPSPTRIAAAVRQTHEF
jgi:pyruvate dehydrogenase E1 component beta subunit